MRRVLQELAEEGRAKRVSRGRYIATDKQFSSSPAQCSRPERKEDTSLHGHDSVSEPVLRNRGFDKPILDLNMCELRYSLFRLKTSPLQKPPVVAAALFTYAASSRTPGDLLRNIPPSGRVGLAKSVAPAKECRSHRAKTK